ncbi:MAG: hypothetical protein HC796_09020 [Synechococcaceae cyanobacterium RL_1_2]|nr:hypothetical protein [Synechococcaceae cyanobacterium RL_1_2]
MNVKRILLALCTVIVLVRMGLSLSSSYDQPQVQSRLELYQTNLVLMAAADPPAELSEQIVPLLGADPLQTAQQQYERVQTTIAVTVENLTTKANALPAPSAQQQILTNTIVETKSFQQQLDLELGLIETAQGKEAAALERWEALSTEATNPNLAQLSGLLSNLWNSPSAVGTVPNPETLIQEQLLGWFKYQALEQLYTVQQNTDQLASLRGAMTEKSSQALLKLALISALPTMGASWV